MTTWILVLVCHPAIHSIPGFPTKESCERAAKQFDLGWTLPIQSRCIEQPGLKIELRGGGAGGGAGSTAAGAGWGGSWKGRTIIFDSGSAPGSASGK